MEYLVVALLVVAIFAAYVAWLDHRVVRLQARSAAARQALSVQLLRRAEAAARIGTDAAASDTADSDTADSDTADSDTAGRAHAAIRGGDADTAEDDVATSRRAARAALEAGAADLAGADLDARAATENDLVRALRAAPLHASDPAVADLVTASRRVAVARQVYNDAVRDTRALALARVPRAFRLSAGQALPGYFDVDELDLEARVRPSIAATAADAGVAGAADRADGRVADRGQSPAAWPRPEQARPGPA